MHTFLPQSAAISPGPASLQIGRMILEDRMYLQGTVCCCHEDLTFSKSLRSIINANFKTYIILIIFLRRSKASDDAYVESKVINNSSTM